MKDSDLIWQMAVARQGEGGRIWLEFSDPRGCDRCRQGQGCGAALFSRMFNRPETRLPMPAGHTIPAGRRVRVGLEPRWLVMAAAAAYLIPVLAFVSGAVLADLAWPGSDPAALLSGLSSALFAVLLLRYPLRFLSRPRLRLVDLCEPLESNDLRDHLCR